MKKLLLSILCLGILQFSFSQKQIVPKPKYETLFKTIPVITNNAPEWVKLLYSSEPNLYKIEASFNKYYKNHTFEKNTHTQNFKYFSRVIKNEDYLQEDGSIYIPTFQERKIKEKRYRKKRQQAFNSSIQNKSALTANWTSIGPLDTFENDGVQKISSQTNVYAISQSITNPNILFAGAETGGVFKTVDKGLNWTATGDDFFNVGSIQSVEIDPTDENTVYIGAEHKILKTTNGGATWTTILDVSNINISAITINPNMPSVVLVAGSDGLRRSTNGGSTWNVLYTDRCWDIRLKTDDPNTIFLAKRNTTKNITEIFKSTDNGLTFTLKDTGWFSPINGIALSDGGARIGVTDADPDRVYVVLLGEEDDAVNDNNYIGIYRSDDACESFTTPYDGNGDRMPDNEPGGPYSYDHWCLTHFDVNSSGYDQGYYNLDIEVSDTDPDAFLIGSLSLFKSEDGGTTYVSWGGYSCYDCGSGYRHPDIQEIVMNGSDVWVTTDGGVDYYDENLSFIESRNKGITGADYWGFDQGWNHDVLVGGRYHNGNAVYYETYGTGNFLSLGGGEAATGYVNKGENRKVYHSDISGKEIPTVITGTVTDITKYTLFPNEDYIFSRRSEIVNDPRYWNTFYLGRENKLWKTENEGQTFTLIKEFGSDIDAIVKAIEVSRNDPNLIFITQKVGGNGKLWRSEDGGSSWIDVTIPANHQTMYLSLNTDNELFLALNNGWNNPNKIFKSTDLGATWINLTTSALNGEWIENVQVQEGTDGGVYLTSNKVIWYRNNTHTDWQPFSNGLPLNFRIVKLLPFYKNGKLRVAGNRGVWETDFEDTFLPKAQPMVNLQTSSCDREIVQFEDFSILNHTGASWQWQFPGATTISSTTVRNPQVTYTNSGVYDVTLTVTDSAGNTSTKTVSEMITIGESLCQPELNPGKAMYMSGNPDFAENDNINITGVTHFTFTTWVKPEGIQPDFSSLFSLSTGDGDDHNTLNFREGNNTLGIHWHGVYWWWDSNLIVPADQWSFVAITVSPTQIKLYVNEESITWDINSNPFDINNIILGRYYNHINRNMKGTMDETTFWTRELTEEEIRLSRHLIKTDITDPNLVAYYQFNNNVKGKVYDKHGTNDLRLSGSATLIPSDVPIGPGTSSILTINSGGVADFSSAGCQMTFGTGTYPGGELVVSKINMNPSALPTTNIIDESYWIINNYGTNTNFDALSDITFLNVTNIGSATASNVELFKRESNEGNSNTWGIGIETALTINSTNESVMFNNTSGALNSFSQFYIGSTANLSTTDVIQEQFKIYPNPIRENEDLYFHNLTEQAQFTLFDMTGKQILKITVDEQKKVNLSSLSKGLYLYSVETKTKIENGKLIVKI